MPTCRHADTPTRANAKRLGKALAAFGFIELTAQAEKFALPDRMVTLGREPLRIDIMTSISGVPFLEAWEVSAPARRGGKRRRR